VRPRSVSRVAVPFALTLAALAFVPSAGATVNVVPNPGFETGPCVGPPIATIICDWAPLVGIMSQDFVAPHSGNASMQLAGFDENNVEATTINGRCIHLPEGPHTTSFWYRTGDTGANQMALSANFFSNPNCAVANFDSGFVRTFSPVTDGQWHQVTGSLVAPLTTQSATLGIFEGCPNCPTLTVNFDDVDIESEALAVTLASFRAVRSHRGVLLRWRTGTEVDTLGFNVFRQQGAKRMRVNRRLLPALGAVAGSSYSFLDRRAPRRAAGYWLQDVSTRGARTWHGPIRAPAA
jgi:hypothetical protein